MALPVRQQLTYWGIAAAVFLVVLWSLGNVLLPFILGAAIAYFLDPLADRFERVGFSRLWATISITFIALLIFVLMFMLVIPTLVRQTEDLIQTAPQLFESLRDFLERRFPDLLEEESTLRQSMSGVIETLRAKGGEVLNQVFTSAMSLLNVVVLIVLVPVITFYLLLDWDNLVARIDSLLPREHAPVIRDLARQIDRTLASFVRGQGTVCLILGTFYAIALMLVGLQFGVVVGFIAGMLTFIPYVGAVVGGGLAVSLALFQFWGEWWWILAVYGIFQFGQLIEGNILTPKLVGQSVGLHPVWLILALSVFGALFGFLGLLVAVPVAAAIGVIARFGVEKYKESPLYRGVETRDGGV